MPQGPEDAHPVGDTPAWFASAATVVTATPLFGRQIWEAFSRIWPG